MCLMAVSYTHLDVYKRQAYNYTDAAAMWGFAFSSVFAFWFLSKNIGAVIDAIKRF